MDQTPNENGKPAARRIPLFRQEAVEHASSQWLGEARLSAPLGMTVTTIFLVALLVTLVVLAFTLQYTRRITITGEIRSEPGVARIAAAQQGTIASLAVREGDRVIAGQRIAIVQDVRSADGVDDASAIQLRALQLQESSALSTLAQEAAGNQAQMTILSSKLDNLNSEMRAAEQQVAAQRQRVELSQQILDKYKTLAQRGYAPDLAVLQRRDDLTSKIQTLESMEQAESAIAGNERDVAAQIQAIQTGLNEKKGLATQQVASIDIQRVAVIESSRNVIRAPFSGRVTGLVATPGDRVSPGEQLLSIVPDKMTLIAVLGADGEAAGLSRVGQKILLRIDAFPYEEFGMKTATIAAVTSSTVQSPGSQTAADPPAFLIYAKIADPYVRSSGTSYSLKPGMTVSGELLLNRKSIAAWLIGPLGHLFDNARQ